MTRKKTSKSSASMAADSFATPELKQIEQLLQFMTEHNLEEFEYSRGDLRIRLRRPSTGVLLQQTRSGYAPEIIVPGGGVGTSASANTQGPLGGAEGRSSEDLHLI